jgi:hypothetical protein
MIILEKAAEKRPSASFPSSFVVAEVQKTEGRSCGKFYRKNDQTFYSGFRAPCIWTFLISLTKVAFSSNC